VVNQLPTADQNAMLHLYSTKEELLSFGAKHYRQRSSETSSILFDLLIKYREEIQAILDALEEFTRQTIDRILSELPPEKLLEKLSLEDRIKGLSQEDRKALLRLLADDQDTSNPK
jgi:hypothetical protein